MAIPIIGKAFETAPAFLDWLDDQKFDAWRPRFVTVHHTGAPDLRTWNGWQARVNPVSDEQWLRNLAGYYAGLGWSAGPHFFVTPKHICVLSPPTRRGVHAVSFNAASWGVEIVGDFDREPFGGAIREMAIGALAAMHLAAGLQPDPYERGVRGLHFHRDDPKTTKTCPGMNIAKRGMIDAVAAQMAVMTPGEHPDESVDAPRDLRPVEQERSGIVNTGDLNVRLAASAKAPSIAKLAQGTFVVVRGAVMNGSTRWLHISAEAVPQGGWVAARYVEEARS